MKLVWTLNLTKQTEINNNLNKYININNYLNNNLYKYININDYLYNNYLNRFIYIILTNNYLHQNHCHKRAFLFQCERPPFTSRPTPDKKKNTSLRRSNVTVFIPYCLLFLFWCETPPFTRRPTPDKKKNTSLRRSNIAVFIPMQKTSFY